MQIQPKLTQAFARFECAALQCEGANAKLLTGSRKDIGRNYWKISFDLRVTAPEDLVFKPTHLGWRRARDLSAVCVLCERLIAVFRGDTFNDLKPITLLQPHCLARGKALTDPVSMARVIGPECWGSGSVNLPFETAMPSGCELPLTNPLFHIVAKFIAHSLELSPRVIMLARLAFLEAGERGSKRLARHLRSLVPDGGRLACVYIFRKRLPMHRDGWTGKRGNRGMAFA